MLSFELESIVGKHSSGWIARKAGQQWEDALEVYHQWLGAQGLAVVHKTGPQIVFVKQRGQVGPRVTGPGPADYVGVLNSGVFVGFEAKSTSSTSGYSIPAKAMHQLHWLNDIRSTTGGWAKVFYIVRYRKLDETCIHRVQDIFPGSRIRRPQGILVPDGISWLDVLNRL